MLAQIRRQEKKVAMLLLLVATGLLVSSCATQKDNVALVNDPDSKPEGAIPWNKQEKWEGSGSQFSNLTDHR